MSSMFPGAQNAGISGGQFVIGNVTNIGSATHAGFDLLRDHCALGALLDAKERFDPARCDEETRLRIIEEILSWIDSDEDAASILWLYGSAGAGKSALGQTLAELLKKQNRLLASFFFSRTSTVSNRRDGNLLVPTLAYQLTQAIPETRPYIEMYIRKDPAIFEKSLESQMDCLFVKPLTPSVEPEKPRPFSFRRYFRRLIRGDIPQTKNICLPSRIQCASSMPRLIVIDGLDECHDPAVQSNILKMLAGAIPHLPYPFRILVASRPEAHITRTFDYDPALQHIGHVHRIDLDSDENAQSDIRLFLAKGFDGIRHTHRVGAHLDPSWPSKDALERLAEKSSTQFIYASTAMRYIRSPQHRPDRRLEIVLGISSPPTNDKPFAELDALYTYIFLSAAEENHGIIWRIFGVLFLAGQPEYSHLDPSPTGLETIFEMQPGDIDLLLDPLLSIIAFPANRRSRIRILHASLFDYLLDPSRSETLRFDLGLAHESLAKYYWRLLKTQTLQIVPTNSTLPAFYFTYLFRFLSHSKVATLSYELEDCLDSSVFSSAYDGVLKSYELSCTSVPKAFTVCLLLQDTIDVFSKEKVEGYVRGLSRHIQKIDQWLHSWSSNTPTVPDNKTSTVFNDTLLQTKHNIYSAVFQRLCPPVVLLSDTERLRFIGQMIIGMSFSVAKTSQNDPTRRVQMHFVILALPHLDAENHDHNTVAKELQHLQESSTSAEPELEKVFRTTVIAYLRLVENYLEPQRKPTLKAQWGY